MNFEFLKIIRLRLPLSLFNRLFMPNVFPQDWLFSRIFVVYRMNSSPICGFLSFSNFVPYEPSDEDKNSCDEKSGEKEKYSVESSTFLCSLCIISEYPLHY